MPATAKAGGPPDVRPVDWMCGRRRRRPVRHVEVRSAAWRLAHGGRWHARRWHVDVAGSRAARVGVASGQGVSRTSGASIEAEPGVVAVED